MLTITEIKRNSSKIFSRQAEENKKANLAMIGYIEHLAQTSSTNIQNWDIEELFADQTNKKLSLEILKNKSMINKVFFERKLLVESDSAEEIKQVLKSIDSSVEKVFSARKKERIENLQNTIISERESIETVTNQMLEKISKIVRSRSELDMLENISTKDKFVSDIEEVLKGNFYKFESFQDNILTLSTKQNVISSLINPKAGLNLSVDLGKFKAVLNLLDFNLKILPHENNIKLGGCYHPYVGTSGAICFGNAAARANELLAEMNVKGVLELLAALLTNFSDETAPHVSLSSFAEEVKRIAKGLPPSTEFEDDEDESWDDSDEEDEI